MQDTYLTLYIEINDSDFIFFVTQNDEQNNFKIIYKFTTPLKGIEKKVLLILKVHLILLKKIFF